MKAYYYDNLPGDQRLPHDSSRPVSPSHLASLGIIHHQISSVSGVDAIASERCYKNRDTIEISPSTLPNYEEKVKNFFHEHLHEDEEIRYILEGGGYFDVRNQGDEWVRIKLEKGDLMIMPAGIYHRFTTDEQNVSSLDRTSLLGEGSLADVCFVLLQYTKAMRLFKEDPKWTPLQRGEETDQNQYRKEYLQQTIKA